MPLPFLAIAGVSAATSLLGTYMKNRNAKKMRDYARGITIDNSSLLDFQERLRRDEGRYGQQAAADVRHAGYGMDQGTFENSVRGAGRNSFGALYDEQLQASQEKRAGAYVDRVDQLRGQNLQAQAGVAQALTNTDAQQQQLRAGGTLQGYQQSNEAWGDIADLGAAGLGYGLDGYQNPGQGGPSNRMQNFQNFQTPQLHQHPYDLANARFGPSSSFRPATQNFLSERRNNVSQPKRHSFMSIYRLNHPHNR